MGIKQKIREAILDNLPESIKESIRDEARKSLMEEIEARNKFVNFSYSQEGEDMILARIFWGKKDGFYVDVGAHHPERFSNTQYFYNLGWRGINIDALPGSMEIFKQCRPRDINIEIPVTEKEENLTYYIFNEPALNSFSKELSIQRNDGNWKIIEEKELLSQPLSKILDKYLPEGQAIDFLSIDVEGYDLNVLKSNNWIKYRPLIVLVEDLNNLPLKKMNESVTCNFLEENGYELVAKSFYTLFFKENSYSYQ